jgi:hypothetical protein
MKVPYFKKPKGKTMDELVAQSRGNYWGCEHEVALVRITSFWDADDKFCRGVFVELQGHGFLRDEDLVQINPDEFIQTSVNGSCKRLGDTAVYKRALKNVKLKSSTGRKTNNESQKTKTKQQSKKKTDADTFHDSFFGDRKKP